MHSVKGIAFASDACIDLIPVDIVSSVVIVAAAAAMASGPYAGNAAKVYHACSAACQPMMAPEAMKHLHTFFSANPCPSRLPFARCVITMAFATSIAAYGQAYEGDAVSSATRLALYI